VPEIVAATPVDGPLSSVQRDELAEAYKKAKPINRVAKVATFNGWVSGVIAALSAPFAFFSISGFVMTIGVTVVAYNEFKGRNLVRKYDPQGARLLGWNQVGFLSLIVIYCIWQLAFGLLGPNPLEAELSKNAAVSQALGSMDQFLWIYQAVVIAVYGLVIVLTLVFQGYNAYFYFAGGRKLQQYIDTTASWIVDLQRNMIPA
jgi:hypothetical protein